MGDPVVQSPEAGLRAIVAEEVRRVVAGMRDAIRADLRAELDLARQAESPERLSVGTAAKRLGVSAVTIRRKIKDGAIPSFRLGRRVLVEVAQIRSVGEIAEEARVVGRAAVIELLKRIGTPRRGHAAFEELIRRTRWADR